MRVTMRDRGASHADSKGKSVFCYCRCPALPTKSHSCAGPDLPIIQRSDSKRLDGSGVQVATGLSCDETGGRAKAMEEFQLQDTAGQVPAERAELLQGRQCRCGLAARKEHCAQLVSRAVAEYDFERPGVCPWANG